MGEFSGREAFDVSIKLRGVPETPEQQLQNQLDRVQYELETSSSSIRSRPRSATRC